MRILITESQLKFLVINEQLLPSVEQATKKYYFPNQKEADGFRAWVHQSYPEIAKSKNLEKSSPYYQSQEIVNVMDTKDPKKPNQSLLFSYRDWQSKNPQQNNNKIKVTDHCGVTKEYDYQTWYYDISEYNPQGSNWDGVQSKPRSDIYTYTIDGTKLPYTAKFTGDWSYLIPKMASKTPEQIKSIKYNICNPDKMYGGNYREQPNLIGLLSDEIKPYMTLENAEITVDIIQTVLQLVPPPGILIAKVLGLIKAIYYAIRSGIYFYTNEIINGIIKGAECVAEIIQFVSAKAPGGTATLSASAKKAVELVDSELFLRVLLQLESQGEVLAKAFKLENKFYKALMLIVVDVLIPKGQDAILSKISSAEIDKLDPFKTISATPWLASIPWLASGVEFVKTILNLITKYLGLVQKIYSALD